MAETKTARASIKAVDSEMGSGLDDGQFRALVSVFGNVDSAGERVMPGAFKNTLAEWESRGEPIPLVWSHQWDNPFANIGHVVKAEETADGLEIVGQLDLEGNDNPTARYVHKLLKTRRINQFSFAYDVEDGRWSKADAAQEDSGEDVYDLLDLAVHEVGPCMLGVNRETGLRAMKHLAETTAKRVVAQALSQAPAATAGKGTTSQAEEPRDDAVKSTSTASNPPRPSPASVRALLDTHLLSERM